MLCTKQVRRLCEEQTAHAELCNRLYNADARRCHEEIEQAMEIHQGRIDTINEQQVRREESLAIDKVAAEQVARV